VLPAGTTAITDTVPLTILGGTSAVYIGNHSIHTHGAAENFPSDRYWHGAIDDIMLFDGAVNASDILAYIGRRNSWDSTDSSLISEWQFNPTLPASTTTVVDSDNAGWTGTLYQGGVASSALWASNQTRSNDRPYIGLGTDTAQGPTDSTPPSAPTGLSNSVPTSDGTVTVTYNRSSDDIYVQSYIVDLATLSNFSNKVSFTQNNKAIHYDSPSTDSITFTDLLPLQTYYVRVSAVDAALNVSTPSSTLSFTTLATADLYPPDPPINLVIDELFYTHFSVDFSPATTFTPPATGLDTVGYNFDVATDVNFNNYVSGMQNVDIGSALGFTVNGVQPLTKYFVRVRGRDAAGNNSEPSAVLVVTTPPRPDTTPPNPIDVLPATSIGAFAFTANWERGVDDTGVVNYYVDVALNSDFTQFAATPHNPSLQGVNVGNVLSYRFDDLQPSTIYYYRVRGEDGAGNTSVNSDDYTSVETLPASLDDGGQVEVMAYPIGDAYTQSASTGTNAGTATFFQVAGNGSAVTKNTFISVNTAEVVGTLESVMLRLYVTQLGTGPISVLVDDVTFTETTITWANQPNITGTAITFTPLANNAWVEVDIASLFPAGATNYTIRLFTTANTTYQFSSREGANPPEIHFLSSPSTATRVDNTIDINSLATYRTNFLTNPSFEVGTTAGWVATGSTPATLAINSVNFYNGTKSLQVTASGAVAGQGVANATTQIPVTNGAVRSVGIAAKSASGTTNWRMQIRIYNSSSVLLATQTKTVTLRTDVFQHFFDRITVAQATAAYITVGFETNTAAAGVAYVDAAIVTEGFVGWPDPMYFDGDTSGAAWTGTARASTSQYDVPTLELVTAYLGDSDNDNSVGFFFKRAEEVEWFSPINTATSINRSTKHATTTIAPTYGRYNMVRDPRLTSFTYWTNVTATSASETEFTDGEELSRAVTTTAAVGSGIHSTYMPEVTVGSAIQARARLLVPVGMTVQVKLSFYNSSNVLLSSLTSAATGDAVGVGEWLDYYVTGTVPASATSARLYLTTTTATVGTFYVIRPLVTQALSTFLNPYRDGTFYADAVWEGTPDNSTTALVLLENQDYDLRHRYTDPDGVVGGISATEVEVSNTFTLPKAPDNTTTFLDLVTESREGTSIFFTASYSGDDNGNMTATAEYRRVDQSAYTAVPILYHHDHKEFHGTIPGLNEGTEYTLRVTISDADGVFGTNPRTVNVTTLSEFSLSEPVSHISFGGFMLMGRDDAAIGVEEHDSFGFPERRLTTQNYLREHGGLELSDFWGTRSINMKGFVSGETRTELEANLNALKRALAPPRQPLIIDTLTQFGRHYTATCETLEIPEVAGTHYRHLNWTARFTCVDPFAYDRDITTITQTGIVNASELALVNDGDLSVFPLITITTKHTRAVSVSIENETTGERIVSLATVRSGQTLVIDNERKALYKNGVEAEYTGGFFTLATGSNTLIFGVDGESIGGQAPKLNVEIQWRNKYL
jgi:hypothetical protein